MVFQHKLKWLGGSCCGREVKSLPYWLAWRLKRHNAKSESCSVAIKMMQPFVRSTRALTKEGAYAKAVGGLTGGLKSFTRDEQVSWAAKLIPQSTLGDAAFSSPRVIASQPPRHSVG